MAAQMLIASSFVPRSATFADADNWIYYKNAVVMMASSRRCNPDAKHLLFTSDRSFLLRLDHYHNHLLAKLGVEAVQLDFSFSPPGLENNRRLANAYFKLDAYRYAGNTGAFSCVFADLDCVWIREGQALGEMVSQASAPLSLIVEQPELQEALLLAYRHLTACNVLPAVNFYGGEFLAGSAPVFQKLMEQADMLFQYLKRQHSHNGSMLRIGGGDTWVDNEEYLMNYLLNYSFPNTIDAAGWVQRITSTEQLGALFPQLTLLHLPTFKKTALLNLFQEAAEKDSPFWEVPLSDFPGYVFQHCYS